VAGVLTWGNDEMEARHGFRLPVREAVERDLASIHVFLPPDGRLLLARDGDGPFGIGCLRRIGPDTAEIKRMYVEPTKRRAGAGRAILAGLITASEQASYARVRLDSPDFMTAAHTLYRSNGFEPIGPYPESEIPEDLRVHWVFMERRIAST
jgi:GNAT superfamily N-acetyltransferase